MTHDIAQTHPWKVEHRTEFLWWKSRWYRSGAYGTRAKAEHAAWMGSIGSPPFTVYRVRLDVWRIKYQCRECGSDEIALDAGRATWNVDNQAWEVGDEGYKDWECLGCQGTDIDEVLLTAPD